MTAPSTCLPRKSSADLRSDFRKIEVTSVTVKTLSAGNGSDRGVGTCEAAGQVLVCNLCGQYKQEAIEVDIVVHKLFDVRVNHGRKYGGESPEKFESRATRGGGAHREVLAAFVTGRKR